MRMQGVTVEGQAIGREAQLCLEVGREKWVPANPKALSAPIPKTIGVMNPWAC